MDGRTSSNRRYMGKSIGSQHLTFNSQMLNVET